MTFFVLFFAFIFLATVTDQRTCPFSRNVLYRPTFRPIFVLGDLHGDYNTTVALLQAAKLIVQNGTKGSSTGNEKWNGGTSVLVQLGDIADRGPDDVCIYSLFYKLGNQARAAGGAIHHIFGNHEAMNLCKVREYVSPETIKKHYGGNWSTWEKHWSANGKLGKWIRNKFEVMSILYNRFVFIHAGLTPEVAHKSPNQLKTELLRHIDDQKCVYNVDKHGDVLWGSQGPLWTRTLSEQSEKVMCPLLNKSFRMIRDAKATSFPSPPQYPMLMFVGHTITPSKKIESRCEDHRSGSAFSVLTSPGSEVPVWPIGRQFIMADTGSSRWAWASPNILEITENTDNYGRHNVEIFEISVTSKVTGANLAKRRLLMRLFTSY